MPVANEFRHQVYSGQQPCAKYELVRPPLPTRPDSVEFRHGMHGVGRQLRVANVAAIYLVHGTFVGDDLSGLNHVLDYFSPRFADWSRRRVKRITDRLMRDIANYPPASVKLLRQAINLPGEMGTEVRRFVWSGLNNHIGRAEAAMRLIERLAQAKPAPGERILVWGHSHGGNVMALMTNLLAASRTELQKFFDATDVYFHRPDSAWQRVRESLHAARHPLADVPLDLVTFGCPIRYGWDSRGYNRLLHFVNHHPLPGHPPYLTRPPGSLLDLLRGRDGDFIHQAGIAGSNFSTPLIPRNWRADRRLAKLFAPDQHWYGILRNVRSGMRVAEEGTTLLVAYPPEPSRWIEHLVGHGIYTLNRWLLFHAEEVVRRLYH